MLRRRRCSVHRLEQLVRHDVGRGVVRHHRPVTNEDLDEHSGQDGEQIESPGDPGVETWATFL